MLDVFRNLLTITIDKELLLVVLIIVGYSGSRKAYRVKNSWSARWGDNGRFWLGESDMGRLLAEQGEACAAIERKV